MSCYVLLRPATSIDGSILQPRQTPSTHASHNQTECTKDKHLAMTDINQWRRRIARTPLASFDFDDTTSNSTTPRRVRPKLSSYFSHYMLPNGQVKPDSLDYTYLPQPTSDTYSWPDPCQPDPEVLMECVMRKLMADPLQTLDARDNSSLMMIFEAHRILRDENVALTERLQSEVKCRYAAEAGRTEIRWNQEKEQYIAEVRRLELLVAKGKRDGLVEVLRARQDSMLKRTHRSEDAQDPEDNQETLFEFLDRTRAEDENARKSQRAYLRPRRQSPSKKMTALSHKFSMTSPHAGLPVQSPLKQDEHITLTQASYFENKFLDSCLTTAVPAQDSKMREMDRSDSMSTYSSFGDPLPDEFAEKTSASGSFGRIGTSDYVHAASLTVTQKTDAGAMLFTPQVIVSRSDRDEERVQTDKNKRCLDTVLQSTQSVRSELIGPRLPRPRPLQLDHDRRFSFDIGDDSSFGLPDEGTHSLIRRSCSLGHLNNGHESKGQPSAQPSGLRISRHVTTCSPVTSPLLPCSPGSFNFSKIPSPVFDASLARPRRGESISSLSTAVKTPDIGISQSSRESNSVSRRSDTSSGLADVAMKSPGSVSNRSSIESGKTTGARKLVEEKNGLRTNRVAIAAARAAVGGVLGVHSSASGVSSSQRGNMIYCQGSTSGKSRQSRFGHDEMGSDNASSSAATATKEHSTRRQNVR